MKTTILAASSIPIKKSPPLIPIVKFLNFYSFLFVVPYTLEWDPYLCTFSLKTSKLREILSFTIHSLAFVEGSGWVFSFYYAPYDTSTTNIIYALSALTTTSAILSFIYFTYIIWGKKQAILELANVNAHLILSGGGEEYELEPNWKVKLQVIILSVASLLGGFLLYANQEIALGLPEVLPKICPTFLPSFPWAKHLLNIVKLIGVTLNSIHPGILVSFTFTLKLASDFYRRQQQAFPLSSSTFNIKSDLNRTMEAVEVQRKITSQINSILGTDTLLHCIASIVYFATVPSITGNHSTDPGEQLFVTYYLVMSGLFWVLASEHHLQVKETTMGWIRRQNAELSKVNTGPCENSLLEMKIGLLNFQQEFESSPVWISCRFFSLTYGFITNIIGIICTYAVITYQMRSAGVQEEEIKS